MTKEELGQSVIDAAMTWWRAREEDDNPGMDGQHKIAALAGRLDAACKALDKTAK